MNVCQYQLTIDGHTDLFDLHVAVGDGSCFFRTLGLAMFGSEGCANEIRRDVVEYVVEHFGRYGGFIHNHLGSGSITPAEYEAHMSQTSTFATFVEVEAASNLFQRRIIVFDESCELVCDEGLHEWHIVVSRFSGPRDGGHFDLLWPTQAPFFLTSLPYISPGTVKPQPQLLKSPIETTLVNQIIGDGKRKAGRPKKIKIGRPKKSEKSKSEQHVKAVKRYSDSHPEVNREAVKRYSDSHPDVNREAVKRYSDSHPEVNRDAVKRYTESHPEVNRDAVKRYADSHPEVNSGAAKRYRGINIHMPVHMRKEGLVGEYSGTKLDLVKPFNLKETSLNSPSTHKCPNCKAKLFHEEKSRKKWCCGEGAYIVPEIPSVASNFYQSPQFLKRPRAYNNIFSFSALGVSHGFQQPKTGVSFLKIQGRTYHRVFDLAYTDSSNPCGMYIDDGEERARLAAGLSLNQSVIKAITDYLYAVNPFINLLKQLSQEPSDDSHLVFQPTTRQSHGPVLGDAPRGTEVAAIISTEREQYNPRQVVIWKIGAKKPHTVDIFHQLYESLQYPLLYPHGTPGWHIGLMDTKGHKLSQVKYYRRLLLSETRFADLGRLSEEWLVDMYCRVEEERLRYISRMQSKNNASSMRSATFTELQATISRGENIDITRAVATDETILGEGGIVPGRVYLPNSFTGGPRYMKTKYMDGMSIVSRLGKPSYFLTVTCNPKWPEIVESTSPGSKSSAQLVSRVFKLKLLELLRDIRCGAFFGHKVYLLYVIEFQKRGLPHAHICFRVEGGGPRQNTDIDKVVRADIPQANEASGRLRELVLMHMLHGPCGHSYRKDLPCWDAKQGKCTKHFPKPHTDVTHVDDRGFVHYKRDSNNPAEVTSRRRIVLVNDTWIVPYNSSLLLKYNCHINLEIASTRKIIKYLFKYITKGPDEARVAVVSGQDINNEVEMYVTKRYIGACDAAWHMLEFEISGREPNVIQLPVHLEGQHSVVFRPGEEADAARKASSNLLLYFSRPCSAEFDNLTYLDFYEQYIVHAKRPSKTSVPVIDHPDGKHFITKRQRGEMVARLFWVSPNRGEQFYLRILLNNFAGRSYADLMSLGGEGCSTFQAAARSKGLVNDELEYESALEEAFHFMTGPRLRRFFVLLLIAGARGADLWSSFKHILCEDLLEKYPDNPDRAFTVALMHISRSLHRHNTRLSDFGLPDVADDSTELGRELLQYNELTLSNFAHEWMPKLSSEQRCIVEYIFSLVSCQDCEQPRTLFIDGPAGSGKTLLLNVLVASLRSQKRVVLCTATSGIAAQNYEGGMTAHSMFRLPLDIDNDTAFWGITGASQRAELIREAAVIIFDEAPMAHKHSIHVLERSLRDLMRSDTLFGGKIVVFAGDFRQIPPVVVGARSPNEIITASFRCSPLWPSVQTFKLVAAQRTRHDVGYSKLLLEVGNGSLMSSKVCERKEGSNLIPLKGLQYVTDLSALIDFVFPYKTLSDPDASSKRALLCVTNDSVDDVNADILNKLPGHPVHLLSFNYVEDANTDDFFLSSEALANVHVKGIPDHDLVIKENALCMITRNLNFDDGLLNGTKVIVVGISSRLVTVRKPGENLLYSIPRITFQAPVEPGSPLQLYRRQFPLRLSYAITINKSQGQTIDIVGVDLRSDVFSHGQLYVALGRVRSLDSIKILVQSDRVIDGIPFVTNVVFRQLTQ